MVNLTRNKPGISVRGWRRLPRTATVVAVAMSFVALGAASAQAYTDPYDTPLSLVNGWTSAPYGTQQAGVKQAQDGVVTFTGAISGGTSAVAFTLPANDWPSRNVYVPVDMCGATNGRIIVQPSGTVSVQAESSFSNAQCFTSLDGAWFTLVQGPVSTALTLQNGWSAYYGGGTATPTVDEADGSTFVFTGAISTSGTNPVAFTLPASFRPASAVFVPVDLCAATNGRLAIASTGVVTVQAEGGAFANAACFTSLDGVSFAP